MASGRRTFLPPLTTTVVTLFHSVVNRPIRQIEFDAIDDIRKGRSTYAEVHFFWHTATFAWYTLVPVGLLLALILGRTIPATIPSAVLALPFVAGSYSFAVRHATPDTERRFAGGRLYALHDLAVTILTVLVGCLIARSL